MSDSPMFIAHGAVLEALAKQRETQKEKAISTILESLKILFVSEADYNEARTRISRVAGILVVLDDTTPERVILSRNSVVSFIRNDEGYVRTLGWDEQNNSCSAPVMHYRIKGDWFIKTENNDETADNLGALPAITQ